MAVRPRGFGGWALVVFSLILMLIGLVLAAGGAWLVALGGSFYYLLAGIGLIVSGFLLIQQRAAGAWLYWGIFLATIVWAFWEVGFNGWALVPRLVGPAVLAVILLFFIPVLFRRRVPSVSARHSYSIILLIAGLSVAWHFAPISIAQQAPTTPPSAQAPPPAEAERAPAQPDTQVPGTATPPSAPGQQAAAPPPNLGLLDRNTTDNWLAYGGNNHATRYSPADQITPQNASQLVEAWHIHTGDMPPTADDVDISPGGDMPPEGGGRQVRYGFQNTPLKVGDTLYVCTPSQIVIALDPATGREKWRFDPKVSLEAKANVTTSTCRGVAYYEAPTPIQDCQTRIVYGTLDSRLLAIDAQTGQPCQGFGNNGSVDLNEGIGRTLPGYVSMTSPPTIVRGIAVVGHQVIDGQYRDAPSGVVRGFDAITGAFVWAWDMCRPGVTTQPGPNETYTRGTPNVWTITSGDDELGLVYLPTGNSAGDYFGGDRRECEEQHSSSLVAVDVATGLERWTFQTVHHDIWDYDLGSQGTLVDFPTDNGSVPALILPTKQGQIYVLDRRNGQPITSVEERPVPQGAVEGDHTAPTQPFSAGMPDLVGDQITEQDMWGVSPLDQLWCRIQFHQLRYEGTYTPPSLEGTIFKPGFNGGVDWGGVAVDPERKLLIVNNNNLPNIVRLIPRSEASEMDIKAIGDKEERTGGLYAQRGLPYGAYSAPWRTALDVPCTAPPWGHIGVIDLRTRKFIWRKPLGTGRDHGPFGIPSMIPITMGTPNNGGSVVTAGGLIFIAAALDRVIRAFNTETGELVWEARLPAGGQAGPLSYVHSGRQYVVLAAGGHNSMETTIGDSVIAYALPQQ
ncbi:membrane-bound PQQ-dependent dehydrogenase, glucose/quinate/shikimate family [Rhodoligotrophos ferricapiens]|uniref:membrane-bound PQQ-dependent dehydrogenase, glucose/quinate/shikimate family n=1 Tax=Rhodoligotrophos ferricapiens TaxID=3069264 RepID=UPI00315C5347